MMAYEKYQLEWRRYNYDKYLWYYNEGVAGRGKSN